MNQLLLHEAFLAGAARYPKRTAVSHGEEERTFGEIADLVPRLVRALAARGVVRGDRVVWWGSTDLDLVALFFATAALGATFTPSNPSYTDEEADAVFGLADPRLVIVDEEHKGDVLLRDLVESTATTGVDTSGVTENDAHVMYFTSGTTGTPKAVPLTHRTSTLRALSGTPPFPRGSRVIMFPLFHMAGWSSALGCWIASEEAAFSDGGDAPELLRAIERRRAYQFYAIPAVWRRILELDRSEFDLSSLEVADTGTSATTQDLLHGIHDALPQTTTSVTYGSTEAGGVCRLPFEDLFRKPGSVGPNIAGVSIRLDDDGELWATSPFLFEGYFRNPDATASALVDGWYRTGELANMDDEGYVTIVGRAGDNIRTGGEWVAPVEVDLIVQSHPAVLDGAVAGVPDDNWGEVVTAFVVLRPGATLELDDLRRHCEAHLARFKVPRRLVLVEAIPRTMPTRQVQRRHLASLA